MRAADERGTARCGGSCRAAIHAAECRCQLTPDGGGADRDCPIHGLDARVDLAVADLGWLLERITRLEDAIRAFDDSWYPQLAGTALGEEQLGHSQSAERWGALCREWRALAALAEEQPHQGEAHG